MADIEDPSHLYNQSMKFLSALQLFNAFRFSLIIPLYPLVAKEKGVSIVTIGYVLSIFALMMTLSGFCIGSVIGSVGGPTKLVLKA